MIGVVGSEDSVRLLFEVAAELELSDGILSRVYEAPEEAAGLAQGIDESCRVLLFTGRVPYELAIRNVQLTAEARYIEHSGADLYRTLVVLACERGGVLPRTSIDTIPEDIVAENFADIGSPAPEFVASLDSLLAGTETADDIVSFHAELIQSGRVDMALTCLSGVGAALMRRGLPVARISHTRQSIRTALESAQMASLLAASHSAQVAVLGIQGIVPGDLEAQLARGELLAGLTHGRVDGDADGRVVWITTTRGALERLLRDGPNTSRSLSDLWTTCHLGVGYGYSLDHAREQARYALSLSTITGEAHVVTSQGRASRVFEGRSASVAVHESRADRIALARSLGMSPFALSRLQEAILEIGAKQFTAKDLARCYGVEARSARRLLSDLMSQGLVTVLGQQASPHRGRPQTVYSVDLDRLLLSIEGEG